MPLDQHNKRFTSWMTMRTRRKSTRFPVRGLLLIFACISRVAAGMSVRPCALVTGSTDGIGLTTAKQLAGRGYDVIIHGRDAQRIETAEAAVRAVCDGGRVVALSPFDLSTVSGSMRLGEQVMQVCQEHGLKLSVLLNNAGVYSESLVLTEDNLELTFAVNVMATFVITSLLLPLLLAQSKSDDNDDVRIVIASSISQSQAIRDWDDLQYRNRRYSSHAAYSETKLMDAMLSMEFASRLAKTKVTCNCLDPGTVNTKMLLAGWGPCGMDVEDALDETWLCSSEDVAGVSGRYFVNRNDRQASLYTYKAEERRKLWSVLASLAPEAAAVWKGLSAD